MIVLHSPPDAPPAHAPGPGDLNSAGPGSVLVVRGEPGARDGGFWGPAIGSAVLRGASVERVAA